MRAAIRWHAGDMPHGVTYGERQFAVQRCGLATRRVTLAPRRPLPWPRVRRARGDGCARIGRIIPCAVPCSHLLVLPAVCLGRAGRRRQGHLQDRCGHGLSHGRRGDAHRQGQARGRRPRHPVRRPAGAGDCQLDPRRGQGHGQARDRLGRQPPHVRAAHRRRVAATERKRVEDAIEKLKDERRILQAAVQAAEAQKTLIDNLAQLPTRPAPANGAAAPQPDWSAALRHDRPALRRGAEDHPRHADQDARGRPADQGPGRQARLPGAGAGGAHRGQDLRQRRRRRSRPTSPSATRSAPRRGCPSTMRASPPAPRRRRRSCSSCAAPASSSAAARAGTTSRSRCRRRDPVPAPRRRSCSTLTVDYEPDAPPRPAPAARLARRARMRATARRPSRAVAEPAEETAAREVGTGAGAGSRPRRCAPASRRRPSRRSTASPAVSPCRRRARPSACRSTRPSSIRR